MGGELIMCKSRLTFILPLSLLFLVGCGQNTSPAPAPPRVTITEFALPMPNSGPYGMVLGPDGALWFTEQGTFQGNPPQPMPAGRIGRITPTGSITEFTLPKPSSQPHSIVAGPDDNLWFTENGENQIGRITPTGTITEFPTRIPNSYPDGITGGPDGNLWSTGLAYSVGRITPTGIVTSFPIPSSDPGNITAGPDGNLWFTEGAANKIGRMAPSGPVTGQFTIPTPEGNPFTITTGPDGALWFTETSGNKIGRITPNGTITEFAIPTPACQPGGITAGPDGALWFTETSGNKIGRITPDGIITEYPLPTPNSALGRLPSGRMACSGLPKHWATRLGASPLTSKGMASGLAVRQGAQVWAPSSPCCNLSAAAPIPLPSLKRQMYYRKSYLPFLFHYYSNAENVGKYHITLGKDADEQAAIARDITLGSESVRPLLLDYRLVSEQEWNAARAGLEEELLAHGVTLDFYAAWGQRSIAG